MQISKQLTANNPCLLSHGKALVPDDASLRFSLHCKSLQGADLGFVCLHTYISHCLFSIVSSVNALHPTQQQTYQKMTRLWPARALIPPSRATCIGPSKCFPVGTRLHQPTLAEAPYARQHTHTYKHFLRSFLNDSRVHPMSSDPNTIAHVHRALRYSRYSINPTTQHESGISSGLEDI